MHFLIRILSRLPLSVLYFFADTLLYPLIYYIVRYRRKIVKKNITLSFPDKSVQEHKRLERAFYHHFADVIVEIIYGYRISDEEMATRFQFDNVTEIEELVHRTGGVMILEGHFGNWEWSAEMAKYYQDKDIRHYNVYRHLNKQSADEAMLAVRAKRGGAGCIEKNQLLRRMVMLRKEGHLLSIGLVSDQKPSPHSAQYWTTFLHQDTAFLSGGEALARMFGYAVVYMHVTSPKRGYYLAHCEVLSDDPKATAEGDITRLFAQRLEANILEQPQLWLWSHNRWKWSRPSNDNTITQ